MGKKQILPISDSLGRKQCTLNLSSSPTLAMLAGREVTFIQKTERIKNDVNLFKVINKERQSFLKGKIILQVNLYGP